MAVRVECTFELTFSRAHGPATLFKKHYAFRTNELTSSVLVTLLVANCFEIALYTVTSVVDPNGLVRVDFAIHIVFGVDIEGLAEDIFCASLPAPLLCLAGPVANNFAL